jgi:CheY-like chemotaxis protein
MEHRALPWRFPRSPDLILMDLTLPDINGEEATRRIKSDQATSRIPVIALTANAMAGDREKALAAGCDDFDTKPVELRKNWGADALIVLSNPLNLAYRTRIGELAARAGLPTIYLYRAHVDAGGLVSYGPDLPDMFRRCGVYVSQILGGAKPADLPIERPARFELVVNLRTAKALGITIPEIVLVRADSRLRGALPIPDSCTAPLPAGTPPSRALKGGRGEG